ncbi:putative MFS transporter [Karstenula rhodostoma CBS 690.94]|uniref:MFS transporter n=1 Tax=Karstenula rhodostoma CBS 690.94 TaxID=1392251 RepID=A0A9P4PTP3_9PLEO|nr:putative MFS transporter [Karstenula rhodostoma CBS 690.94]
MLKKVYCTYIPTIVGFLVCFASATTVPAEAQFVSEFHVSSRVALFPFSFFTLGLAFGPLLAAPISENYGRRPVYLLGLLAFSFFTLGAGFSPSFTSLVLCRFFAGAFGGAMLVVGFGFLADVWTTKQLPVALSIFNVVPFCGPAAGQLVSSYIIPQKTWAWTQWPTLFLAAFIYLTILPMPETYRTANNSTIQTLNEVKQKRFGEYIKSLLAAIPFVRPLHMLIHEPVVCLFSLYIAFNFTAIYCFSASIPFVFKTQYGFSLQSQGLVFTGLIVGYLISGPTMIFPYMKQMQKNQAANSSSANIEPFENGTQPESLLWPALIGAVALPVSFFWFGWSAEAQVHWACPITALGLYSWGNNLLYNAAQLYLLETYGSRYGASATAANNLLRYIWAAILPLFMTTMYSNLGTGWASSLLGFILVLFVPIPWVLRYFGPKLRSRSVYLQTDEILQQ